MTRRKEDVQVSDCSMCYSESRLPITRQEQQTSLCIPGKTLLLLRTHISLVLWECWCVIQGPLVSRPGLLCRWRGEGESVGPKLSSPY
ncbi:hypothetical protein E2C01_077374 [Portunus trituberculatus]|uniref:Uncharacterized protein n=1 Tax=Portunus trituberculatus TaxID=210409 RepID=A0A5B7IR60_PORTR|nr:hypothetical protein [Portunus trituberculatus]